MQSPAQLDVTVNDSSSSDTAHAHSRRGIAVALPAQGCRLAVHFTSICILSRLLTPDDFGVAGMVLTVTGFLELFKDGGLGMALVQAKSLTPGVVATLYWIVAVVSVTLGGVMLASGPILAWLYREPRVVELVHLLAIAIVANGLAVVPQSMMRRELKFGQLAFIDVTSPLVGVTAAVLAASHGYGYRALAVQPLVLALTSLLLSVIFRPMWPGIPKWSSGIRDAIYFGGNLSGFGFVNYSARNLDKILLGRYWGSTELGMYVRAYTLLTAPLSLINNPLSSVYVPILSRLQSRPDQIRIHYLKGLSLAISISLPLSAALVVCAEEIVQILLGAGWGEVVGIFRLLSISAPFQFCGNTTGWLFTALGRTDRQFRWGIFASIFIVASFFVGLPWSSHGVALSYSCAMLPLTYLNILYATRDTEITVADVMRCCFSKAIFAVSLGTVLFGIKWACSPLPPSSMRDCVILGIAGLGIFVSLAHQIRKRSIPEEMISPKPNVPRAIPLT